MKRYSRTTRGRVNTAWYNAEMHWSTTLINAQHPQAVILLYPIIRFANVPLISQIKQYRDHSYYKPGKETLNKWMKTCCCNKIEIMCLWGHEYYWCSCSILLLQWLQEIKNGHLSQVQWKMSSNTLTEKFPSWKVTRKQNRLWIIDREGL